MTTIPRILFVVENDHYPQDMRVRNECLSLSRNYTCYVFAPRASGQKFIETVEGARCYRYPNLAAESVKTLPLEYLFACFWMLLCIPMIVLVKRIGIVHVANPPDFIIPVLAWLRFFGVRFVFDVHDVSTETLKGKMSGSDGALSRLLPLLAWLERRSLRAADLAIATNDSIAARLRAIAPRTPVCTVRNSGPILHRHIDELPKDLHAGPVQIGYFGVLANDPAAGLENILALAKALTDEGLSFQFSIVGSGPGQARLQQMVQLDGLGDRFVFHGFVMLPSAYTLIRAFDFGLVSWGDMPKNNLHTAMKVMDYMCCGVPVCSLNLKEQLRSTGGIGVHAASFEQIAAGIARLRGDPLAYEDLRRQTLRRFNESLGWEIQERKLLNAYDTLCHGMRTRAHTDLPHP